MTRYRLILWAAAIVAAVLYIHSAIVWHRCGYDCGILAANRGPSALAGQAISIMAFVICGIHLIVDWARRR